MPGFHFRIGGSEQLHWLLYNVNCFISTEVPSHVNILRSNNAYIRKVTIKHKFVFLQHGIIYLKNMKGKATFGIRNECEAQYMIVSSEKEKDVCVDMLGFHEERLLNTGLAIMDSVKYRHINEESEDIITIMLTWREYEENILDIKSSSYYQYILEIMEVLSNRELDEKIYVIPHPKMLHLFNNEKAPFQIWMGAISEILKKTKLLVTDYSSVCYNCFYQGAGVVFYHPDIVRYEAERGKLIPDDEEFIGYRVYDKYQLQVLLDKIITNRKVNLALLRIPKFEKNYDEINEHSDSKNTERIYDYLKNLQIL